MGCINQNLNIVFPDSPLRVSTTADRETSSPPKVDSRVRDTRHVCRRKPNTRYGMKIRVVRTGYTGPPLPRFSSPR